jgi:hypothetical protein
LTTLETAQPEEEHAASKWKKVTVQESKRILLSAPKWILRALDMSLLKLE